MERLPFSRRWRPVAKAAQLSVAGGGGRTRVVAGLLLNQEIKKKMVCTAERRSTGGGRRRRRGERRDVMEQYRKLRLVLPNINSRGKISKQV